MGTLAAILRGARGRSPLAPWGVDPSAPPAIRRDGRAGARAAAYTGGHDECSRPPPVGRHPARVLALLAVLGDGAARRLGLAAGPVDGAVRLRRRAGLHARGLRRERAYRGRL